MLSLALSLLLSTAPPQPHQTDWAAIGLPLRDSAAALETIGLGILGAGGAIALFWNYIIEDKPNQKPKLTLVPPPEQPAPPAAEPLPLTPEIEPEPRETEPQFPDIDWEADPPSRAVNAPAPSPFDLARLAQQLNIPLRVEPGQVPFESIAQIPFEQRLAWLEDYLEEHDLSYLLRLLQATPIVVYGLERSGKNTFACTVAALRRVFFPQPILAASPHANGDNPFPAAFQTTGYDAGTGANYRAIAAQLRDLRSWVKRGDTTPVTTLWDETSSYEVAFDKADRPLLDKFLFFTLTECSKHNKQQIILASGMTNACLPGAEGIAREKSNGLIAVSRYAEGDKFGAKKPSPHLEIEGLSRSGKESFTFPSWLNARWIFSAFPECNQAIELPEHLSNCIQIPVEPLEPISTAPEPSSAPSNLVNFPSRKGFDTSSTMSSSSSNFPAWYIELDETGKRVLFNSVRSNLEKGLTRTQIVKEVFEAKSEKYAAGAAAYDDLMNRFNPPSA